MPAVFAVVICGLIYIRKQLSYVQLLPGIYLIELATLLLVASIFAYGAKSSSRSNLHLERSHLALSPILATLSLYCLVLGLAKTVSHFEYESDVSKLQELPIVVYPFFWAILLTWLSAIPRNELLTVATRYEQFTKYFPLYWTLIYLTGILEWTIEIDKPLWPNNNFIFATCILSALFFTKRNAVVESIAVLFCCSLGLTYEAQRGAFLCLAAGIALLLRSTTQALRLGGAIAGLIAVVAIFGSSLSFRFEGGVSDLSDFLASFTGSSEDIRYSSTEHRSEMWSSVLEGAVESPTLLLTGKPLRAPIVNEEWRNPHNGYLSALGRGGLPLLAFYVLLFIDSVRAVWATRRGMAYPVVHLIYFTGSVDALTQTAFDSPYSLFLILTASALSIQIRSESRLRTARIEPMQR